VRTERREGGRRGRRQRHREPGRPGAPPPKSTLPPLATVAAPKRTAMAAASLSAGRAWNMVRLLSSTLRDRAAPRRAVRAGWPNLDPC
jgi:hypothetical protein